MNGYLDPGEPLIARAAPVADGLVDAVRRRDGAAVGRLLSSRSRSVREMYALVVVLADWVAQGEAAPERVCPKCGHAKPVSEFYAHRSRPGGVHGWCKECHLTAKRAGRGGLRVVPGEAS